MSTFNEFICNSVNRFVGINASDINYTAGRYDPNKKPPFPVGFEVGEGFCSYNANPY